MEALPRESDTHGSGDVGEGFAVEVAEHGVRLLRIVAEIVHITIGGIQIFPPVVVIVDEAGAPAADPVRKAPETSGVADVSKKLPAIAGEKREYLRREIVVKEVHEAVVVKVLGVRPHPIDGNSIVVERYAVNGSLFAEPA